MGGGGLRILPHKSWHVWRRENIERVLRDERLQAEQQQKAEQKRRGVEQERRAEALERQQKKKQQQQNADNKEEAHGVRLFALEEQQQSNNERPGARAAPQQHQQTLGKQATLPWYAKRRADERDAPPETSRRERKRKRCDRVCVGAGECELRS